jgi:hypothetical protein
MDSAMSADTPSNEDLLVEAARNGDEGALAALVERHRDRLERMVGLRLDRRLQGRVDAADVVQEAYLTLRGKFPQYIADPRLPFSSCGCGWKWGRSSWTCTASTWGPRCATPGRKSCCTVGRCRR